jgi:cell pole-organizing protein PopZ
MSLPEDSLVSPAAAQASTSALARLTRAVAPEEKPPVVAGRSVEELVIELLRPQLKEWLDQNLAPLVERVVEQEIKKLARRAELL